MAKQKINWYFGQNSDFPNKEDGGVYFVNCEENGINLGDNDTIDNYEEINDPNITEEE